MEKPSAKRGTPIALGSSVFYKRGQKPIGKGDFGEVWRYRNPETNEFVAIKKINIRNIRELQALAIVQKVPNVLQLAGEDPLRYAGSSDGRYSLVISEVYEGNLSQLYHLLETEERLSLFHKIAKQLVTAIYYSNKLGIMHLDIKPGNVLTDIDRNAYLADFGSARWIPCTEELIEPFGHEYTDGFESPEILAAFVSGKGYPYSSTIEVWPLGCTLLAFLGSGGLQ